ncbi:MAG: alcohol dehydrogenase [Bradyrhizobium sp.]|nr:alcohol dehydrogenase [Bradyrhizobium sp.]
MRGLIHHAFADPAGVLVVGEAPAPTPGPGQVRIRTLLSPIHNHDLWTVRGEYGFKSVLPAIGGSEAVGIVDATGEGVDAAIVTSLADARIKRDNAKKLLGEGVDPSVNRKEERRNARANTFEAWPKSSWTNSRR